MKTKSSQEKQFDLFQKAWGFLENNKKTLILIFSLFLFGMGMVMVKLHSLGLHWFDKKSFVVFGIFLMLSILVGFILLWSRKRQWKIEKVYLVCGLILGLFYCFCLPVGVTPDEPAHFRRVYAIAEGNIVQQDDDLMLPRNIIYVIDAFMGPDGYDKEIENLWTQPDEVRELYNTPNYAFINYVPQTIGVLIGRVLHLPLIMMLLLARLLNMISCVLSVYFCIKYIPILKKVVFAIALFPMTMQLFASVSADGSIICAGIASISFVLYAREKMKRKFNVWDFLLLLFICLALIITKPVYIFLCPVVFWIPRERFKSQKWKLGTIFLLGALCLVLLLLRLYTVSAVGEGRYGDNQLQTEIMLYKPWKLIWLIFMNSIMTFQTYFNGIIGSSLEWFSLDYYYPYVVTIIIVFAILCCERQGKVTVGLRIFSVVAFVGIIIATFASMFLTWSMPGSELIEGVQGRYFLPALLLIPLACLPSGKEAEKRKREIINPTTVYVVMTSISTYIVTIIVSSHIVG